MILTLPRLCGAAAFIVALGCSTAANAGTLSLISQTAAYPNQGVPMQYAVQYSNPNSFNGNRTVRFAVSGHCGTIGTLVQVGTTFNPMPGTKPGVVSMPFLWANAVKSGPANGVIDLGAGSNLCEFTSPGVGGHFSVNVTVDGDASATLTINVQLGRATVPDGRSSG